MVSVFLLIMVVGCQQANNETKREEGKVVVTTTIGQIADIVKNVGGEHVQVEGLMGPGVDPHLYQPSHGDIKKLQEADLIFYNGLHLEGKMDEVFKKISKDKPVVAVGESVPKEKLLSKQEDATAHDPHIWFDIELWSYAVHAVKDELIKYDQENKADYEKNADEYLTQLEEVQSYAKEQFSHIPGESRVLVTAHDAFGYFGRAYDIDVKGLQGLSTDAEYGLKDVQSLVNMLAERNVKAVFVESSVSQRSIQAVVEGAKKKGHTVSIGGELFSDAMGEEGTEEGTYIGMYRHNIDTIVSALK